MGIANSVVTGAKMINETKPDLILLDIEMPDGTGFDLIDLLHPSVDAPIIFITGSEDYAIRAFQYAAADYILKPVDEEQLSQAVHRAMKSSDRWRSVRQTLQDNQHNAQSRKLVLHTSDEVLIVPIAEIVRCQSMDNYCQIHLIDGRSILMTKPLKHYEAMLSQDGFLRVHQSHLVNLHQIKSYIKKEGGYLELLNGTHVPVSFRKRAEVISRLDSMADE